MNPEETVMPFEEDDHDAPSYSDGEASFEALDPAWGDPGYWDRFQEGTLALVEPELARRRRAGERITVSEVVTSWSRTVVPVAMAAAAAAVMVLLTHPAGAGEGEVEEVATQGAAVAEAPSETAESGQPAPSEESEAMAPTLDGGPILTLDDSGPAEMSVVLTAAVEGF